jgi:hypothetical protein
MLAIASCTDIVGSTLTTRVDMTAPTFTVTGDYRLLRRAVFRAQGGPSRSLAERSAMIGRGSNRRRLVMPRLIALCTALAALAALLGNIVWAT